MANTIRLTGVIAAKDGNKRKATPNDGGKKVSYFYTKGTNKDVYARLAGKCVELKTVEGDITKKYILLPVGDNVFKRIVNIGKQQYELVLQLKQIVANLTYKAGPMPAEEV